MKAEGEAQAKILRAKAEGEAIRIVAEAANKYFDDKAQAYKRLEVSNNVLAQGTKYVIPTSSDVVNVLNLDGDSKITPLKHQK